LTHTSGIGDYVKAVDYRKDYTDDELLRILGALEPEFAPGEGWRYSNSGYVLLGLLITKVTGCFFVDFMQERLFLPLEMHTARGVSDADIVPHRSSGYRIVDGELKHHDFVPPSLNRTGDGCYYMTVLDFAKWDAALYTERVLKRASLRLMWTPVELNGGETHAYGFGWNIGQVRGNRVLSHAGGWQGFNAYMGRFIDKQLTVVVLCNRSRAGASHIARGVAGLLDAELGPWKPTEEDIDREHARELVGDYDLGRRTFRVTLEDEGLFLILPDEELELFGGDGGRYSTRDGSPVRFRWNRDGLIDRLEIFGLRAARAEPLEHERSADERSR